MIPVARSLETPSTKPAQVKRRMQDGFQECRSSHHSQWYGSSSRGHCGWLTWWYGKTWLETVGQAGGVREVLVAAEKDDTWCFVWLFRLAWWNWYTRSFGWYIKMLGVVKDEELSERRQVRRSEVCLGQSTWLLSGLLLKIATTPFLFDSFVTCPCLNFYL